MPTADVPMYEEDYSESIGTSAYEVQQSEQERIDLAAAKERAAFLFAKLKLYNSKEDLEFYAASKIAALARGAWARTSVTQLKSWKTEQKNTRVYIRNSRVRLHNAKMMVKRYMEASKMTLHQWKDLQASIIQKGLLSAFRRKVSKKHTVAIAGDTLMISIQS